MKKILAAAALLCAAGAMAEPDMDKYTKSCAICHATGAAAAWEARLAKGMEALVASVSTGMNAMPPKGMCFDCSDEDYKALIEYMAKPAE